MISSKVFLFRSCKVGDSESSLPFTFSAQGSKVLFFQDKETEPDPEPKSSRTRNETLAKEKEALVKAPRNCLGIFSKLIIFSFLKKKINLIL